MSARETIADFIRRTTSMSRIVLPFLLLFFFCPEPAQPALDDFLPSATNRIAKTQALRPIGPARGAKSDALKSALAVGSALFTTLFQQLFVLVERSQASLHQYFAGYRSVRAPPPQAR